MRGFRTFARFCKASALIALLGIASVASAATIIAPAGQAAESPTSSGLSTPIRIAARAYQEYFAASNFSTITQPVMITGMQYRLAVGENWRPAGYAGQTWPDNAITTTRYDVQLSKPSAQLVTDGEYLSLTPTYASYQDGGLTTVRSGPLTFAAGSFPADGANPATDIHSFGPLITFTTPYLYTPGDGLVMMLRAAAFTGTTFQAFVGSRAFQNGVTDAISSTDSADAASPNGFSSPVFVQFTFSPVPEPTSLSLAGLAALGLFARRRH